MDFNVTLTNLKSEVHNVLVICFNNNNSNGFLYIKRSNPSLSDAQGGKVLQHSVFLPYGGATV